MYDETMNEEQNISAGQPSEPVQNEPIQSEPVQCEAIQNEPMQDDVMQGEPVQSEFVQSDAAQCESVQSEFLQSDATQSESVQSESATNGQSAENNEYRYGRSYYQSQQDSVYYTNPDMNQNPTQKEKKKSGKKVWKTIGKVVACIVLVAAVGSAGVYGGIWYMNRQDAQKTSASNIRVQSTIDKKKDNKDGEKVEATTVSKGTAVVTDVSEVVANVMPSVVSITNVGTQTYSSFFGQTGTYESESNGSGIIIGQTDDELLVVTNQHVVAGADTLKVIFIDEESCEANVKGTDADKDIAVIAIPISSVKEETLQKIKVATLGDSNLLNVGEPAIAIGNALGYGQSVTLGVISAKDRQVTTEINTNKLIQTDAAINPGNSGGALLNIAGEVIGINSAKAAATQIEGVCYAIPISDVTPIINELMNKETKTKVDEENKAYIGISGVDITSDVAQNYNMPKGVYVAQVTKGGPAEEAGLKKGDIITKLADVSVTSFEELKAELEYHAAGTTVELEIQTPAKDSYGYESKTVSVTLAKKND